MKKATQLREWLTDASARQETSRKMRAFAARRRDSKIDRQLKDLLAAPVQSAADILEAVHDLFRDDAWVAATIAAAAAESRKDPFFTPPFLNLASDIHRGLSIFEDRRLFIAMSVVDVVELAAKKSGPRGKTSIGFNGRISVLKFINSGDARLSFWEVPPIGPDFTAAAAGRCTRTGERLLADGDILVIDGRRQTYVVEHARTNLLLLQAEIVVDQAPLAVEFDSATGEYVGCSATDDRASRIQMIATLLRKLDCEAAVPAMAALLDHPDFFVRWHVMSELLGLDAEAALPGLRRMAARDPHREVRAAARATLDHLESRVADRKAA